MTRMDDIAHLARRCEHDEPDHLPGEAPPGSGITVVVLVYAAAVCVLVAVVVGRVL